MKQGSAVLKGFEHMLRAVDKRYELGQVLHLCWEKTCSQHKKRMDSHFKNFSWKRIDSSARKLDLILTRKVFFVVMI